MNDGLREFELRKEIQNLRDKITALEQDIAAIQQGLKAEYGKDEPSGDVVADFGTFIEHHKEKERLADCWRVIALRYAKGCPTEEDVVTVGLALMADLK